METHAASKTNTQIIFDDCDREIAVVDILRTWVKANPWIDSLSLAFSLPDCPILRFRRSSRKALAEKLGADGWRIDGCCFKKTVDAIEFQVDIYPEDSRSVSREEMLA